MQNPNRALCCSDLDESQSVALSFALAASKDFAQRTIDLTYTDTYFVPSTLARSRALPSRRDHLR